MTFFSGIVLALSITLLVLMKRAFGLKALSPPVLMAGIWIIFILAGLVFFAGYPWSFLGLIWICLLCITFMVGYIGTAWFQSKNRQSNKNPLPPVVKVLSKKGVRSSKIILLTVIIFASAYVGVRLQTYGVSLADISDVEQLAETNNEIAVARYSGGASVSTALQMFLPFVYLAPLLGGFLLPYYKKKEKLFCIASLMPVILLFSLTNEKAAILQGVALMISGFLVGYLSRFGTYPSLKPRFVFWILVIGGALLSILIMSMVLRIGTVDMDTLGVVLEKLGNSYALSHMPAFDGIFPSLMQSTEALSAGKYTFFGIADLLGIATREQGVYQDFFVYGDISTNVYTAFRGLILDFGVLGSLIFSCAIGILAAFVTRIVAVKNNSSVALGALAAIYMFILFSFAISFMSYASLVLTFALFVLACKVIVPGIKAYE